VRVSTEVTCADFTSVDDLRRRVRGDLQREIGQVIVDTPSRLSFVGPRHPEVFVDRKAPLAQLRDAFATETPQVALVAPAGMGKTALARRFLANSQLSDPDPVWLSTLEKMRLAGQVSLRSSRLMYSLGNRFLAGCEFALKFLFQAHSPRIVT
jgi:ATP/maltotriose-dependent transcriptional regulator MalT